MSFIVVLAVLFLDRLTKSIATSALVFNRPSCVIKGVLYFTLVHNRGAAFGILKGQAPLFILTSLFAIALIYTEIRKGESRSFCYRLSMSLILAGALGNLIDRVYLGHVVDFIDFRIWPVFNVADSAITIGAILLGYSILNQNPKAKTKK